MGLGGIGELGPVFGAGKVRGTLDHELIFHGEEQPLPAADAFHSLIDAAAQAAGARDVFGRLAGILHGERSVVHAEEAGAVRRAADGDVVGQRDVAVAGQPRCLMSRDGAERRKGQGRVRRVGGVHQLPAAIVVAFGGGQRANDGQVAASARRPWACAG